MDSIPPSPQFLEYCQTHLRVLDLWSYEGVIYAHVENLKILFEACYTLQEFSFSYRAHIGSILGLIPSNSVTLIRLRNPASIVGTTYNSCWGHPLEDSERWFVQFEGDETPEYERLGVSIREIAQRFSEHNCGLRTRAQVVHQPLNKELRAFNNGEIPLFMTKLEEELGTHVTLELDLLPVDPEEELWT